MINNIFYPDAIPSKIRNCGSFWCLWTRRTEVDEKGCETIDKAPYSAKYYNHASVNNSQHFCSYDEAVEAIENDDPDGWGLGICLGFDEITRSGFVCIDIDDCVTGDGSTFQIIGNDVISAGDVNEIIQKFGSYTEVSPSGTGIHIFAPSNQCGRAWKKNGIEVYYTKRFIRLSGRYLAADYADVRTSDAAEEIKWLTDKYCFKNQDSAIGATEVVSNAVDRAKARLISWLEKNKIKFSALSGTAEFPVRIAVECPWKQNHTTDENQSESAILVNSKGFFIYKCLHAHCDDKKWSDYMRFYDKKTALNLDDSICDVKVWLLKDVPDFLKVFGSANPVGDYSDKGQANQFCRIFGRSVAFLENGEWVCYDGKKWNFFSTRENAMVSGLSQKLTDIQLYEAKSKVKEYKAEIKKLEESRASKADIAAAEEQLKFAEDYHKYAKGRRSRDKLCATVDVAKPDCLCSITYFDGNPCLINTPNGVVDLDSNTVMEHNPGYMLSKMTAVSVGGPFSSEQVKMWDGFLNTITGSNSDLKEYLQLVFGSAIVGKVYGEYLYIAYGSGGNGKSTLCNAVAGVLGDYAGYLDAEYFNSDSRHNQLPQLAKLRGERLIIASETSDTAMLDSAAVKRLVSTDCIHAEAKYKAPFDFYPTHTVILCTSRLPAIKGVDNGIWDRLVLIPFETRIRNTETEIKNYADVLRNECGEYILAWCIEGARKFLDSGGKIPVPTIVQEAINKLRRENCSADCFFEDCCCYSKGASITASALYDEYKKYCQDDENLVNKRDFKAVAENYGFRHKKTRTANVFMNVTLKNIQNA